MTPEDFRKNVARLAKQIDGNLKPGHAIRIKEFEEPHRTHIINTLVQKYFYKQEIPFHLRKPALNSSTISFPLTKQQSPILHGLYRYL